MHKILNVEIMGTDELKDATGAKYTVFVMTIKNLHGIWTVKKRYSELSTLNEFLSRELKGLDFPTKVIHS